MTILFRLLSENADILSISLAFSFLSQSPSLNLLLQVHWLLPTDDSSLVSKSPKLSILFFLRWRRSHFSFWVKGEGDKCHWKAFCAVVYATYLRISNVAPTAAPGTVTKKMVLLLPLSSTIMFGLSDVSDKLHRSTSCKHSLTGSAHSFKTVISILLDIF